MEDMDRLMNNASSEQRKYLIALQELKKGRQKLIDKTKSDYDRVNCSSPMMEDNAMPMTNEQAIEHLKSYSSSTKRSLDAFDDTIKKEIQDARKSRVLIVNYDNL